MAENIFVYMCREEYRAYRVYRAIARVPLISKRVREIFRDASEDEYRHYMFWRRIVGECSARALGLESALWIIMAILFGVTVILKLVESAENSSISIYREVEQKHPEFAEDLKKLVDDEEKHEKEFIENVDEARIRYLGSIALGISDALVELTGIYAGSLGVFANTLSAGVSGLIAGISAAISMAIASYSQAKHEGGRDPKLSALYTGIAYVAIVLLLSLPYFILQSVVVAFTVSISIAIAAIAYLTFYSYAIYRRNYLREFGESLALLLGVSIALYIVGDMLKKTLGIKL